jgi:hypothetical protein
MPAELENFTYYDLDCDPQIYPQTLGKESESEFTVHDIYPVEREIRFVGENLHLSDAELEFYIEMNIKGMLGEFVGNLPYKVFSYVKRGDCFEFAGIRVEESYSKAAQMAGVGSREESDWIGFKKIQESFLNGDNTTILISPPKSADYSFVNIFIADNKIDPRIEGSKVDVHLICYPEDRGTVKKSAGLLSEINGSDIKYQTANEFLQNPVVCNAGNSKEAVERVLEFLNISKEEIAKGKQFEGEIDRELEAWIREYAQKTIQLAKFDGTIAEYEKLKKELRIYLEGIYNRARRIKKRIGNPQAEADLLMQAYQAQITYPSNMGFEFAEVLHWAKLEKPVFKGGSDCMPTQNGKFGINDIVEALSSGRTLDQLVGRSTEDESSSVCSKCGRSTKDKHYHCPECGEKYADETSLSSENRTKICKNPECDHKFGC